VDTGGLSLVEREEQVSLMEEQIKRQKEAGPHVKFIGREDLSIMVPHVAKDVAGAAACRQSSRINSLRVVFGYEIRSLSWALKGLKVNLPLTLCHSQSFHRYIHFNQIFKL